MLNDLLKRTCRDYLQNEQKISHELIDIIIIMRQGHLLMISLEVIYSL